MPVTDRSTSGLKSVLRAVSVIGADPDRVSRAIRTIRVERATALLRELGHDDLAGQLEFYERATLSARNERKR